MKKFLTALGILFLLILIVGGTVVGYIVHQGSGLDTESKNFVDSTVPKIISHWDMAEFDRADDKAVMEKAGFNADQESKLFAWCQKTLGPMTEYKGAEGQALINFSGGKQYLSAQYSVSAAFQNGPAAVNVTLSKDSGEWKIVGFFVSPKTMPR